MIVLYKSVLEHLGDCGECADYNSAYSHVYPERSSWDMIEELMHSMTSPVSDIECVRISGTTF